MKPNNVELVTFTGIDESVRMEALRLVGLQYPWAEFAALVGTYVGGIFPPRYVIDELKNAGVNAAIHLCGKWARSALRVTDEVPYQEVERLCAGFSRVQLNLHGDHAAQAYLHVEPDALAEFAEYVSAQHVIVQHTSDWEDAPLRHPKVEYLFDLSAGSGTEGFRYWPNPPAASFIRVGYSGGLGAHNIARAREFAMRFPDSPMWFDMERRIRNERGWLDLSLVRAVCVGMVTEP